MEELACGGDDEGERRVAKRLVRIRTRRPVLSVCHRALSLEVLGQERRLDLDVDLLVVVRQQRRQRSVRHVGQGRGVGVADGGGANMDREAVADAPLSQPRQHRLMQLGGREGAVPRQTIAHEVMQGRAHAACRAQVLHAQMEPDSRAEHPVLQSRLGAVAQCEERCDGGGREFGVGTAMGQVGG
jgi:hypothetical protein